MFARFDICGVLLSVEWWESKGRHGAVIRVMTQRPKTRDQDGKFIIPCKVNTPREIDILKLCKRGDLIQAVGNVAMRPAKNPRGKMWYAVDLWVGYLDRLMTSFSYHASGKCLSGAPPTKALPDDHRSGQEDRLNDPRDYGGLAATARDARTSPARQPEPTKPSSGNGSGA